MDYIKQSPRRPRSRGNIANTSRARRRKYPSKKRNRKISMTNISMRFTWITANLAGDADCREYHAQNPRNLTSFVEIATGTLWKTPKGNRPSIACETTWTKMWRKIFQVPTINSMFPAEANMIIRRYPRTWFGRMVPASNGWDLAEVSNVLQTSRLSIAKPRRVCKKNDSIPQRAEALIVFTDQFRTIRRSPIYCEPMTEEILKTGRTRGGRVRGKCWLEPEFITAHDEDDNVTVEVSRVEDMSEINKKGGSKLRTLITDVFRVIQNMILKPKGVELPTILCVLCILKLIQEDLEPHQEFLTGFGFWGGELEAAWNNLCKLYHLIARNYHPIQAH
ncbi:uncharacterized protein PAC_02315 [Phialocephala subalpina]|uniref:Uncharacterized protein n=1 Tax=Phialocephala subalpina TaxID=576137 RepID=A0A1L7WI29_9HELO|nr:uncharacterized protein PAC_02315 [Phialocephala subalpina]